MVRKEIVTLIDDLDGSEAAETIRFAFGSGTYEIDLSTVNASALREALAPYVAAARRASSFSAPSPRKTAVPAATAAQRRAEHLTIRAWARANGHNMGNNGRIPERIMDAYRDRTPLQVAQDASAAAAPTAAFSG